MKKISIPEPCHENWADFTPTQKGAFCGSCKIDVVDFSNKSPNEVKTILKDSAGKHMCGRFKKTQLDELNDNFFAWQNQSTSTFQSKFLYACLIVFGITLFSGCSSLETTPVLNSIFGGKIANSDAQLQIGNPPVEADTTKKITQQTHKKGKIKYVPEVNEVKTECETPPDSLSKINTLTLGKIAFIEETDFVKGDIDLSYVATPPDTVIALPPVDTIQPYPNDFIMGDFIAEPYNPIEDTIKIEVTKDTSEEVPTIDPLYTDEMVDGGLMIDPEFYHYIEDTTDTKTPLVVIEDEPLPIMVNPFPESFQPTFTAILYPNPTRDEANIQLEITKKSIFNIYLYAINGKQIKAIYDGLLERGVQTFKINLSAYEAGSYLIVINSEKQKESLRLEKVE